MAIPVQGFDAENERPQVSEWKAEACGIRRCGQLSFTGVFDWDCHDPGLRAARFGPDFRGLKQVAEKGRCNGKCLEKRPLSG
jgi:hypothetical protein